MRDYRRWPACGPVHAGTGLPRAASKQPDDCGDRRHANGWCPVHFSLYCEDIFLKGGKLTNSRGALAGIVPDLPENGAVNDLARSHALFLYLPHLKLALAEGANIQGYFYWSLLNN